MNKSARACAVRLSIMTALLGSVLLAPMTRAEPDETSPEPAAESPLASLVTEALALQELVEHPAALALLDEAKALPVPEERTVHVQFRPTKRGYTAGAFAQLSEEEREGLQAWTPEPLRVYSTFYGTPLAYMRALDLLARAGGEGFRFNGKRVLDFGYGQLGQVRMLAGAGARVVGVDVDPILEALYSTPGDTGPYTGASGRTGIVKLITGAWPSDKTVRDEVGDGYDVFIARNVLKRGYIAPVAETPDWQKVDLGMPLAESARAIGAVMNPGGLVMVYNLGGRPGGPGSVNPDEPYNAPADIADPWTREHWEAAGFEVLEHSAEDTGAAHAFMRALGQLPEGTDPVGQIYARYTLLRKR